MTVNTNVKRYQMYINGEFVESNSKEWFQVINPATEEVISEVPSGSVGDARKAIDCAEIAQKEWKKRPSIERARYLNLLAEEIRKNSESLAQIISEEQGKVLLESRGEVAFAAEYFDYMAGWARKYEGEIVPSDRPNETIMVIKEPVGVVTGIIPWNAPFFIMARKVAPALVTGNTIVLKPSSDTPNSSLEFAKLVDKVGIPKGVINIITGHGGQIGYELAANPKIGLASLTGSGKAGKELMKAAADSITKVSLELGGKAPAIVAEDADIDLAVRSILMSRFLNVGQACNSAERVYVHEKVEDEFIEKITAAISAIKIGNPLQDEDATMGPIATKRGFENIESMVTRAVEAGAKVLTGGKRANVDRGYFYEPTVLVNVKQDMEIMQEEVFGPVLPIMVIKDLDEAIELANDCQYGLTSSIFTQNLDAAMRAATELNFGETYINREHMEAIQGFHAGRKKSGIGGEDGKHGLEEYLATHVVYLQYNPNKK